jgi:hypothetical protein
VIVARDAAFRGTRTVHRDGRRQAVCADSLGLFIASEPIKCRHHPSAGLRVIGPHVEVAKVARSEVRRNPHHLALGTDSVLPASGGELLVAHPVRELDIGAPHRRGCPWSREQRLEDRDGTLIRRQVRGIGAAF